MQTFPQSVDRLINEFSRLPGIGKKTAQRLTFHLLNNNQALSLHLSNALKNMVDRIKHCSICHGVSEEDICKICMDERRDEDLICVVENAFDIFVFESINSFSGRYHVLGGVLSPIDGTGPDDLNIGTLSKRLHNGMEVIIATNPSVEGETTALYLSKILSERDIKVSKLALGIPVGGDLEYVDVATLTRAMEGRISV
tara:strand:- start:691 stop:1284 length:594 start_codon:yes stop_codon:yes gene_type:complete